MQNPINSFQTREKRQTPRLLQWWYSLTALPEPGDDANFVQQEKWRRSRFLSGIVGGLLFSFVLFIPGCLALPNPYVIVADLGMMPLCVIALILNKVKKPTAAGILLTLSFEAALTMVVLTSVPFDDPVLQQYELFVFGELLAVSLITPGWVFAVGGYNIGFITWSLLFQQYKDAHLLYDLSTQFAPIWVRPVAVQILVAAVTFMWVRGERASRERADKAELTAQLEHQLREQEAQILKEKIQLQESIQQIVALHSNAINNNVISKISHKPYPPVLGPLITAINLQQSRWLTARQADEKLRRLQKVILDSAELANQCLFEFNQITGTIFDEFVHALNYQLSKRSRSAPGGREHFSIQPIHQQSTGPQVIQMPEQVQPSQRPSLPMPGKEMGSDHSHSKPN